jgi:hypothetical protein
MIRKIAAAMCIFLFSVSFVSASDIDTVREAAAGYAEGEVVMVDGPFYVDLRSYYVIDYMLMSEVKASLAYDLTSKQFVTDDETMRKVFATKDLKNLVVWDPLFYAIGNHTKIPLAAKYETQNVRNFAEFASLTEGERAQLDTFLESYENLFEDIAECSRLTNSMLYPEEAYLFEYSRAPPNIVVEIYKSSERGSFSYEGFQQLIDSYEQVYSGYLQLGLDLSAFAGALEEYPPGTTIREKWEVVLTKEGILEEVELVGANSQVLDNKIAVRKDILSWPYDAQISTARDRLGLPSAGETKKVCGPTSILLISLAFLFLLRGRKKLLGPSIFILLTSIFLVGIAASSSSGSEVPRYQDLISQKITNASAVKIEISAEGMDNGTARDIVEGFPLLLEGESVIFRGPYYYSGNPNYIIDIIKEGEPTGYLILIDGTTYRLVASQRTAFQLQKARFLADMIEGKALYQDADASALAGEAEKTDIPPLKLFLTNLSINAREGKELEQNHTEKPDFETARDLAQHYIRASVLLRNIERATSSEEAKAITHNFSEQMLWLEAYGRVIKGLSADEYLESRRSQYRGRSLNRLPLMQQLGPMGMSPSKAQVVHDLTSDLIYDNTFLWHLGKVEDPALFARLAFKEGTFTLPASLNATGG